MRKLIILIILILSLNNIYAKNINELINEKRMLENQLLNITSEIMVYKSNIDQKIQENINMSNIQFRREIKNIKDDYRKEFLKYRRDLNNIQNRIKRVDREIEMLMQKDIDSNVLIYSDIIKKLIEKDNACYNNINKNNKTIMVSNVMNCNVQYIKSINNILIEESKRKKY